MSHFSVPVGNEKDRQSWKSVSSLLSKNLQERTNFRILGFWKLPSCVKETEMNLTVNHL